MFNFGDWKSSAVLIGGIIIAYLILKNDAVTAVKTVAGAVNPLDKNNVVNQATESFYKTITDSPNSPGADFYDFTHNEDGSLKWYGTPLYFLDKAIGLNP